MLSVFAIMPTVAFVVTLYNKRRFLEPVLAGLAAQAGAFERRFVFVDDGSTDDTVAALRALTAGWRGVVIAEQANAGPAAALNRGLELAEGDYIKPVDGDDVLAPWATSRLLDGLAETGCGLAFARMERQGRYDPARPAEETLAKFERRDAGIERIDPALPLVLKGAQTNPSAWLARADPVRRSGGCDRGVFVQDYSIELRLAALTPFARLDEKLLLLAEAAPDRVSANQAQILHDVNRALIRFLRAHPELPPEWVRAAMARAAARSWAWARRRNGASWASPEARLNFWSRTLGLRPTEAVEAALCRPFLMGTALKLGSR